MTMKVRSEKSAAVALQPGLWARQDILVEDIRNRPSYSVPFHVELTVHPQQIGTITIVCWGNSVTIWVLF